MEMSRRGRGSGWVSVGALGGVLLALAPSVADAEQRIHTVALSFGSLARGSPDSAKFACALVAIE